MTQRLVHHDNPEGRQTPLLLLSMLRAMDPQIELVYVGRGVWWLGGVRPNAERARKGEMILKQMEALQIASRSVPSIQQNIMLGKLLLQGFARIATYFCQGDPTAEVVVEHGTPWAFRGTILADFTERHSNFLHRQKELEQAAVDDANGVAEKAASDAEFKEYLATEGLANYRREIKNRVTFGYGGQTGGAGRLILTP